MRMRDGADAQAGLRAIKRVLREKFAIEHATVEIEARECADGDPACSQQAAHRH